MLGARVVPALMETIEAIEDGKARRVVAKRIIDAEPEIATLAAKLAETVSVDYLALWAPCDSGACCSSESTTPRAKNAALTGSPSLSARAR